MEKEIKENRGDTKNLNAYLEEWSLFKKQV